MGWLIIIVIAIVTVSQIGWGGVAAIVAFGIIGGIIMAMSQDQKRDEQIDNGMKNEDAIVSSVRPHLTTLAIKYKQLVYTDDYGKEHFNDFERELERCIDAVVPFNLKHKIFDFDELIRSGKQMPLDGVDKDSLIIALRFAVKEFMDQQEEEDVPEFTGSDPTVYERYCGEVLDGLGWLVRFTPATGDQGADILAEKNGLRLVVQCKLYSSPAGNDAVQQVIAAKGFYQADAAAVIASSGFTKAARQLAAAHGVHLAHQDTIAELDEAICMAAVRHA